MRHLRNAAASVLVGWAGAFAELAKAVRPPQRKRKPAWYDEAMQQRRKR